MTHRQHMLSLVKDFRQSGMTQKQFCQAAGIGLAKLNYWIARSKEASKPSGFVPLTASVRSEVTLHYPSGVKIAVDSTDLSLIARLVNL